MGINTNLLNFSDERVKKILSKFKMLKCKPAVVQNVNADKVTVKFENNTIIELPNLSGNFVLPNTVVLVYYWGNVINKNTAYIGKNATSVTVCNSSEYNAKENVLYFIQDTGEIYIGKKSYGISKKEFESMFAEIKKLLEEIKAMLDGESTNKLYGLVCADLAGLDKGISGNMTVIESEG